MKITKTDAAFYYATAHGNRNHVIITDCYLVGCLKVLANADKYFKNFFPEFYLVPMGKPKKISDKQLKDAFVDSLGWHPWTTQEKINLGAYFKYDVSDFMLSARKKTSVTKKLNTTYKQTGSTDRAIDRQHKAKKPGYRKSATGTVYRETRANRSDVDRRKRI